MTDQDLLKIIELAKTQFSLGEDTMHGIDHWHEVCANGLMIASANNADVVVVQLFAYLHDCKRVHDYDDDDHGVRAADYVLELRETTDYLDFLTYEQVELLQTACRHHNTGSISFDTTIGTCFDADRIELIRCRIIPKPELMSTTIGKRIAHKMQAMMRY